jgi:TetR/AcrR family transcriptional repressor of nem operon
MSNAAVELAPFDPETQGRCRQALVETEAALVACIERGQDAGEIRTDHEALDLARFLITSINGLRVMAKANPDRKALEGVAEIALSVLD